MSVFDGTNVFPKTKPRHKNLKHSETKPFLHARVPDTKPFCPLVRQNLPLQVETRQFACPHSPVELNQELVVLLTTIVPCRDTVTLHWSSRSCEWKLAANLLSIFVVSLSISCVKVSIF
eukprot:m.287497 g.287497  ORF g.287497 m.287497 type:complete len:119 (+) comp15790_c4_seq1:114-470(+)